MQGYFKFAMTLGVVGYFVACAPVKFEKEQAPSSPSCETLACVKTCEASGNCFETFTIERKVGEGLVDILIVNDNSGSMSTEQEKMGDRFPTFLNSLGQLDYRIAMTTTDISSTYAKTPVGVSNPPSAINQNGKLQDGNLISFLTNGTKYFLARPTNSTELAENISQFNATVKRNETLQCEASGYATNQCPSSDERGIYAANLVLDRTASQFMRPLAHLAIVILADEDERGMSDPRSVRTDTPGHTADDNALIKMYPLENYDKPETLLSNFHTRFPEKTMSIHSIIVRPGDTACLNAQAAQGSNMFVRGTEGYTYKKASELTGGKVGSICDSDYGAQLADIGSSLQEKVTSVPLVCDPVGEPLVWLNGTKAPESAYDVDHSGHVVEFPSLKANDRIKIEYTCAVGN